MAERATLAMPYPWQGDHWDGVSAQYQAGRLPHAIMLNGPVQVGKGRFARALAQLVICAEPLGGYACGHCRPCRLIAAGSHPDLQVLAPEEEGRAIKIDQVRALCDLVAKTAQQGGWKVAIIEPAEAMNINAANALLKSLEEPSPNTLMLLVCHQLSAVSATIRSRCRMLSFAVPPPAQSLEWLAQVTTGEQDCQWLLEQADGRPLQALKLIESDILERRKEFLELLSQVSQQHISAVVAAEKSYRHNPLELLDWLMSQTTQTIRRSPGDSATRNWFKLLDRINTARRELQGAGNPNLQLLWESLLMDWQALTAGR